MLCNQIHSWIHHLYTTTQDNPNANTVITWLIAVCFIPSRLIIIHKPLQPQDILHIQQTQYEYTSSSKPDGYTCIYVYTHRQHSIEELLVDNETGCAQYQLLLRLGLATSLMHFNCSSTVFACSVSSINAATSAYIRTYRSGSRHAVYLGMLYSVKYNDKSTNSRSSCFQYMVCITVTPLQSPDILQIISSHSLTLSVEKDWRCLAFATSSFCPGYAIGTCTKLTPTLCFLYSPCTYVHDLQPQILQQTTPLVAILCSILQQHK